MSEKSRSSVTKAKSFLTKLGLSYDSTSPAAQKYLLDMIPSGQHDVSTVSGSVIATRFNNVVNTNMKGGRVSLPLEYFGVETNNYNGTPVEATVDTTLVRSGLTYSGMGGGRSSARLLSQTDFETLTSCYEKRFLRKLTMTQKEKKALLNKLNADISEAVVNATKTNKYGRLTKQMLEKNLKI